MGDNFPLILKETSLCIAKDFAVPPEDLLMQSGMEEIQSKLKKIIQHLMNHDFNRLLNIFYRIDLDEKKVAATLELSTPDEIAGRLAELVIEREMIKAETRLRYR